MEQLMRSAQAGRIVHALLFVGPHGTGKKTMAELMAQTVLCRNESGNRPCGVCPSCKKCESGMHPDIHYVRPEKNTIKIEQIRELNRTLSLASVEGGKKIAVIDPAGAMNESAQNALLKTLENPTGDTLFFLLTDTPGALLPTVVSRCLQLRFRCLENDECVRVLKNRGIEEDRAQLLAALSQGSVGRAIEIDADEDYIALRHRVIDAVESVKKPADVLPAMVRVGDAKGREKDVFEMLELWARDLMRVQNGAQPVQLRDAERLQKSACCGNRLLQGVISAKKQLSNNVSWANTMENLLFGLAGEKG
ncbi:MAG: DNA polymerase III subunit delta' [Clostridia bacterium]|nr:DNA polymerase III subunit delta' [Clostridia bacterium]